jgi:hypothetical protein
MRKMPVVWGDLGTQSASAAKGGTMSKPLPVKVCEKCNLVRTPSQFIRQIGNVLVHYEFCDVCRSTGVEKGQTMRESLYDSVERLERWIASKPGADDLLDELITDWKRLHGFHANIQRACELFDDPMELRQAVLHQLEVLAPDADGHS